MHTQRQTYGISFCSNKRKLCYSVRQHASPSAWTVDTYRNSPLFTQVPRPCATFHHMFQVCINTGSCLYNTVNYLHAARGHETTFRYCHTYWALTLKRSGERNPQGESEVKIGLYVCYMSSSQWGGGSSAPPPPKKKINSRVWVSYLSTRLSRENV
jgi:hypothetical protein